MCDELPEIHLNFRAATLLEKQAQRSKQILERLAAHFAAIEPKRPDEVKDLVEEKHVQRAADFLFGSVTVPEPHANVFISFSHDDAAFVDEISEMLTKAGITHFKADRDVQAASDWAETIWKAIRGCPVFLSIITPRFLNSRWRDLEGGAALASKNKVLTVLRYVDQSNVGHPFDRWQSVVVETMAQLEKLVETVQQILNDDQENR